MELQPAQATGMGTLFTHKPRHMYQREKEKKRDSTIFSYLLFFCHSIFCFSYGIPRLDAVLSALDAKGVGNVQVRKEAEPHSFTIEIPSLSATLKLSPYASLIDSADEAGRLTLRDIIVSAAK